MPNKTKCSNCGQLGKPNYYKTKNYCKLCGEFERLLNELEEKVESIKRRARFVELDLEDTLFRVKVLRDKKEKKKSEK